MLQCFLNGGLRIKSVWLLMKQIKMLIENRFLLFSQRARSFS